MWDHLLVLGVTVAVTVAATGLVRVLAVRVGAVVAPDERRIHDRPTPTLGGLAMVVGLAAGLAVATITDVYRPAFDSTEPLGVLAAAVLIALVGLADDVREVSAPAKVAGQALAGAVLAASGVTMFFFRLPFGDTVVLGPDLAPLVTVGWVVLFANAVNLIDGLDGLAAGIVAIASAALFSYSLLLRDAGIIGLDSVGPLVALVTLGVCLGFLPHNRHPARIFMGDTGALLLGLLMASATIVVGGRANEQFAGQNFFFFAPVVIPLVMLGVAVGDTVFAVARRALRGGGIATADKSHVHHRLLRLGHGHARAVVVLWGWTAVLSAAVLLPIATGSAASLAIVGAAAAVVAVATFAPGFEGRSSGP